jgi:hypothetical protein
MVTRVGVGCGQRSGVGQGGVRTPWRTGREGPVVGVFSSTNFLNIAANDPFSLDRFTAFLRVDLFVFARHCSPFPSPVQDREPRRHLAEPAVVKDEIPRRGESAEEKVFICVRTGVNTKVDERPRVVNGVKQHRDALAGGQRSWVAKVTSITDDGDMVATGDVIQCTCNVG